MRAEPAEPMLVQTLSLVDIGTVPLLRKHRCDLLNILATHNIAEGFATPTVRSLLRVRWLAVEPYFYMQLGLYIFLLVCFAAHTSTIAPEPSIDQYPSASVAEATPFVRNTDSAASSSASRVAAAPSRVLRAMSVGLHEKRGTQGCKHA